ncbi:hypothetical protein BDW02DRAFT_596224 [Decorospora gaudefroyi]|uniref:Uncharacterized protein n=1 Tax=Decorospora gaudefroyi TaxID=184978 RepID=A0A6A5KEX0_9PLEO|nr:hypothetical protein BDW02DRAFT_596224 [Decorospora gaudefroyi]
MADVRARNKAYITKRILAADPSKQTLTSKKRYIYSETALLPFSAINRFWYYDDTTLSALIKLTNPVQFCAIAKLFFYVKAEEPPSPNAWTGAFDLDRIRNLDKLTGLKHVTVLVAWTSLYDISFPAQNAALACIKAGLEDKIRAAAVPGVDVVFKLWYPTRREL